MEQQAQAIADPRIDEEDIRLTTGFADIFTAILLVGGGMLLTSLAGIGGGVAIVAAAFALGAPLVARRRFAAAGNVLAVGSALGTGVTFGLALGIAATIPVALVCYAFWRVHRVPLALALVWIAGAGLVAGTGLLDSLNGLQSAAASARVLLAGLLLFGAGMFHDSRDRLRRTRQSDVAFWLHLAAAPLLVHGFFSLSGAGPFGDPDQIRPLFVLVTFAVLAVISLLIDRRPLLASSFVYLVAATYRLLRDASAAANLGERELAAAMAPAVIGVLLLFLAAGWTPLRRLLLRGLPAAWRQTLPPAPAGGAPAPDRPAEVPAAEGEPVRLVLGFNDFFVALGAASLFVGCIFVGVQIVLILGGEALQSDYGALSPAEELVRFDAAVRLFWIPVGLPALAMWLVAEWFVRVRRMAWPAIVSACAFALTSLALGSYVVGVWWYLANRSEIAANLPTHGNTLPSLTQGEAALLVVAACAIAALASLAFWWRHRVPVSFALACATLLPLAFLPELSAQLSGTDQAFANFDAQARLIAAGIAAFAAAMMWDRSDPARTTPRSDTAFWMHLLAGLLVIPAGFAALPGNTAGQALVLAGFAALTVLAVAIDRRAPLVVALPFLARAMEALTGGSIGAMLTLAVLVLLLALVLRWDQVRARLLSGLAAAV